jgi:TetR/AcrR family tetracycline transcriptional repressor
MTARGPSGRSRLDRDRILEAALDLVDREGLEALTMRRLGGELRVDPMTVHHHVETKDRLLDGIAELLWREVVLPNGPRNVVEALRSLARSLRDLFRRHPQAAPLILRSSTLPRSELELFNAYLNLLDSAGVDEPATVLRPLLSYAVGYGSAELSMLGVQCERNRSEALSERERLLYLGQALPPGTSTELSSAAAAMIADCDPDRCFEEGLDRMLGGLPGSSDESVMKQEPGRT